MKVRIGYGLGTQGMDDLERFGGFVDSLDRLGFDSLWLSERITGPAPDPLAAIAWAAGRTQRLKFGTSVLVVPGRNPAVLAKELASIDVLSGGRMLPAVGLGVADPAEQQAFGVGRKERAAWFDEAMPLIRRFWTETSVDHEGERFRYEGLNVLPKPVQDPFDVWLGGQAPAQLRRVGRQGDGWLPSFCTPDDVAAGRKIVEEAAAAAGREIEDEHWGVLMIYVPDGAEVPQRLATIVERRRPGLDPAELVPVGLAAARDRINAFLDVGFSKFVLVPAVEPASWDDHLSEVAADVLPLQA